jgi:hypothetical protein
VDFESVWECYSVVCDSKMRPCPSILPMTIEPDFNFNEVGAVTEAHLPHLGDKLDWITSEKIDGIAFQTLNHSILQSFGVVAFGDRARILHLQKASQPTSKIPGKDMLQIFGVSIVRSEN